MKKIIYFLAFICSMATFGSTIKTATTEDLPTSAQRYQGLSPSSIPAGYTATQYYQEIQEDIYFPASVPTTSINETFIENTFGSAGANLDASIVTKIKQAYCFLEFLYKLNQVQNNSNYQSYQTYYSDYLNNSSSTIFLPTAKLVASEGWTGIPVTGQDLQNSDVWQLFVKSMITNCFLNDYTTIEILHQVKTQIFSYIPNIETAYYTTDFSNLRNLEEVTRIKSLLHDNMRAFYLAQCSDWKNESASQLGADVLAFKNDQFFILTNVTSTYTGQSSDTSALLTSPTREYAWCFCMFQNIILKLYSTLSLDNLNFILTHVSSTEIFPCFTDLNQDDLAILYDFYLLQANSTSTATTEADAVLGSASTASASSTVTAQGLSAKKPTSRKKYNIEELLQAKKSALTPQRNLTARRQKTSEVSAQSYFDPNYVTDQTSPFLNDIAIQSSAASEAAWKSLQETGNAFDDFWKSLQETFAGWGASLLGDITGDQSLKSLGESLEDQSRKGAQAGLDEFDNAINDLGTAIKDGIACWADMDGAFVSLITGDIQCGKDTAAIIENISDQIVDILSEATVGITNYIGEETIAEIQLAEKATDMIVDSVMIIATDGKNSTYISDLSADGIDLLKGVATSILNVCTAIYDAGKAIVESVMTLLSAVVNSISSIFIDIIRETDYIFNAMAQAGGANVDADELLNEVTKTLNDNRSTINEVVGVVVAIAISVAVMVCTAGAGAPAVAAMDAALIGGTEGVVIAGAEGAVIAGAEGATIAGAEGATIAGAEGATIAGAEGATIAGAEGATITGAEGATITVTDVTTDITADTLEDVSEDTIDFVEEDEEDTIEFEQETEEAAKEGTKTATKVAAKTTITFGTVIKKIADAINYVFQAFSIISGVNADANNQLKKAEQEDSLRNMWNTIGITKIYNIQSQSAFMNEIIKKQAAEISNQKIGLILYENYLNAAVDNDQRTIAQNLAQEEISRLTPDTNGMQKGNIGYSTALVSPFFDLYPSQGFTFATAGRPDFPFSQEIATTPVNLSSSSNSSSVSAQALDADKTNTQINLELDTADSSATSNSTSSSTTSSTEKFWFNQRASASVNQKATDPLNVEIKFNIIYKLNSEFHTGIFVGGTYHDYSSADYLSEITTNQSIDLDAISLAKLFVIYRDSGTAPWQIGVYEPEGAGWLVQETLDPSFYENPDTYHMSALLNGTSLVVTFWGESNPETKWTKTLDVAATDQRPYGVIYSGVAVEWGVVSPAVSYTKNKSRLQLTAPTEITRSKAAIIARQKNLSPTFGSITLSSITNRQALNQQYIYQTTSTNILDSSGNKLTDPDYVVFATNKSGTISNIGTTPSDSTANVVVSLISGNVYNSSAALVTTQSNVWTAYQATHSSIDQSIIDQIKNTQTKLIANLLSIDLGSYTLTAVSSDMLLNSQYVYTSTGTITDGSGIIDYLTPCTITSSGKLSSSYGNKPATSGQAFVSFVTGNLFNSSGAIVKTGYSITTPYQTAHGTLPADVLTAIARSTSAWQAAVTVETAAAAEDTPASDSRTVDASSMNADDISTNNAGLPIDSSDPEYSLQDRANSAAGSVGIETNKASVTVSFSLPL